MLRDRVGLGPDKGSSDDIALECDVLEIIKANRSQTAANKRAVDRRSIPMSAHVSG